MPIYAYKCQACGHAKDVLQKMSDPVLTDCPACGKSEFQKQVTAAGFQLKGSGWYVTDFRGGNSGEGKVAEGKSEGKAEGKPAEPAGKSEPKSDTGTSAGTNSGTGSSTNAATPAASTASSTGSAGSSSSAPASSASTASSS